MGETNTNAYSSFSGIDIIAVVQDIVVATLQGVSYSITREKAPVYTFGSANPRSFSRGKRGIAGSMIFTLFDRSALYQLQKDERFFYYAHEDEQATLFGNTNLWEWAEQVADDNRIETVHTKAEYADQIMPFDITLIAQNEYGLAAWMGILGVEILNEGGGLSVDDITNEEQMTYVARAKTAWVPWSEGNYNGNDFQANDDITPFLQPGDVPTAGESALYPVGFGPAGEGGRDVLEEYAEWLGIDPDATTVGGNG